MRPPDTYGTQGDPFLFPGLMFASFGGGCLWLVLSILEGSAFYFVGISEQFHGGHQLKCVVPWVPARTRGACAVHVPGVRDASAHVCVCVCVCTGIQPGPCLGSGCLSQIDHLCSNSAAVHPLSPCKHLSFIKPPLIERRGKGKQGRQTEISP